MSKRQSASVTLPSRGELAEWFSRRPGDVIPLHALLAQHKIPISQQRSMCRLLDQLVREGRLERRSGHRYRSLSMAEAVPAPSSAVAGARRPTLIGRLWRHAEGFGFVTPVGAPADGGRGKPDLYISRSGMADALHGDLVEVEPLSSPRGRERGGPRAGRGRSKGGPPLHGASQRLNGRIVRVVERAHPRIVGRYHPTPHGGLLVPLDERLSAPLPLSEPPSQKIAAESMVVGELVSAGTLSVRLIRDFGFGEDPRLDTDLVIEEFSLSTVFAAEAEQEAEGFPSTITPDAMAGRRDLRALTTMTIDGEQARDFDDAISIESIERGYRLWVHIADVGHYVPWDSALDRAARQRGTSVYFPDRAVPMLPERLSNGLCSLKPLEDRLAVTVVIDLDRDGHQLAYDLYESVIRSDARLTYTGVAAALGSSSSGSDLPEPYASLRPQLQLAAELAERLRRRRMARGSLDFDLPEPQIVLDLQGRPTDILKEERTVAHRLVEECMLTANETVAQHLTGLQVPMLYRIHEPPDPHKLETFSLFAHSVGFALMHTKSSTSLQALIDAVRGRPEERLLNHLLLRSMKQARYGPEPLGHFGLASPCYTHFTSPIRRYPDLVIHRLLKQLLARGVMPAAERERLAALMPQIGQTSSARERTSMEAEWEVVRIKKARFMAERIGETYRGYITGVAQYGLFVEPESIFVEGLVPVRTLPPDQYRYDEGQHTLIGERSRQRYRLGDPVVVQVTGVNFDRRQVNFMLEKSTGPAPNRPRRAQPRRGH